MREAAGLSQEGLAERANLHRNYVGSIERGERNVGLINIVALDEVTGADSVVGPIQPLLPEIAAEKNHHPAPICKVRSPMIAVPS